MSSVDRAVQHHPPPPFPSTSTSTRAPPHAGTTPKSNTATKNSHSKTVKFEDCPFLSGRSSMGAVVDPGLSRPATKGPPNYTTLIFSSVSVGVSNAYLKQLFKTCGPVRSFISYNKPTALPDTTVPVGYGFVEYADPDSVIRALTLLNGLELPSLKQETETRKLRVAASDDKTKHLIEAYNSQRTATPADAVALSTARRKVETEMTAMSALSSMLGPRGARFSASLSEIRCHTADAQPAAKRQKTGTFSSSDRNIDNKRGSPLLSSHDLPISDGTGNASLRKQPVTTRLSPHPGSTRGHIAKPPVSKENNPPDHIAPQMCAKRKRDGENGYETRPLTIPLAPIDLNAPEADNVTL
ncbi:hypothetical protein SISSUDRAFT_1062507 [Sistotremastrum suecicum HHB10207 ss-3]|uniref:RRM domain-containing protein n=1 Tax=Sistotremastrum suecicum HHB10207 ss-3 TaxID=1314776 RepID=A0A166CV45_9AGAM|nr:hypothetical protein SISSUDRAFT_1062507 [Sistotremastrum suecicum HHB10207 ss-3]